MKIENFFLKFTSIYFKVFGCWENTLEGHHELCLVETINSELKYFIQIDSFG